MFKVLKISLVVSALILLNSCASGYKKINPETIGYVSQSIDKDIVFEYKYDLLKKKYKRKEEKNNLKLVAVKIINNSEDNLVFGRDLKLTLESGSEIPIIDNYTLFKQLKQSPASHLFYLLLAPIQLYSGSTTTQEGPYYVTRPKNVFPIGLIVGPGIAGTNLLIASSANKKLKTDLQQHELMGRLIKKGETVHGIVGLNLPGYEAIKLKKQW